MDARPDIAIISSYGRGNWLASELRDLGLEVALLDVSEAAGMHSPEDVEGPFGYFQSEKLSASQKARLDQEDYSDSVDDGFVVWLKSGPIDFRGPQAGELFKVLNQSESVRPYVERYDSTSDKGRSELVSKMKRELFEKNWVAQLAHSLASPVAMPVNSHLQVGRPLPLFAPYSIRRVSRMGQEKALQGLKDKGVRIFSKAKIADVSVRGNEILSVEVSSQWSGALTADQFIWALSSAETARISKKAAELFFDSKVLESSWVWVRYRFEIRGEAYLSALPNRFLFIGDKAQPWSHENFVWMQKTASSGLFDAWMRIPTFHRFQRSYHDALAGEAVRHIGARLSGAEVKVYEFPQEYHYDESVLGPSRHQQYDFKAWRKHRVKSYRNILFDSPELWPMSDWNGQFEHQSQVLDKLKKWKTDRDLKLEKLRAKNLSIENQKSHSGDSLT